MAKYYGVLPSQVVEQATTFDLQVYDISLTWEKHQRDEANGVVPEYSQEQLLDSLNSLKE
jgi:hypothetical protein